jgi:ATP-dependent RNA helicase DbpA
MNTKNAQLFSTLNLDPKLLENLISLNYTKMTQIQALALPTLLKREDLTAKAKTGSGKTLAFAIAALSALNNEEEVQTLVITPTRELAEQVATVLRELARYRTNTTVLTLCGGTPLRPQADALKKCVEIVVGTPGRIKDHLAKGTLDITRVHTLILDEADIMLDMGFIEEIEGIIRNIKNTRHTMLFSATYPKSIENFAKRVQSRARFVEVENEKANDIEEIFVNCNNSDRVATLRNIITHYQLRRAIIFCNTKEQVKALVQMLGSVGDVLALHGDLEQRDRDEILLQFDNESTAFLIATDVASRGLDIDDVESVINYDLPHQLDTYTHRIGRTGRMGKKGLAISLFSAKERKFIEAYPKEIQSISITAGKKGKFIEAPNHTIALLGGKKSKIRKGDIIGALIKEGGFSGDDIGKIVIKEKFSFVALKRDIVKGVLKYLENNKIKGKKSKAWLVEQWEKI